MERDTIDPRGSGERANPVDTQSPSRTFHGVRRTDHGVRRTDTAAVAMDANDAKSAGERFGFGTALEYLLGGNRVSRSGWNGPNQYIELQRPDLHSKMTRPYLFIRTVQGDLVPWLASQTDLLATDWCRVTERTILVYHDGREGRSEFAPIGG